MPRNSSKIFMVYILCLVLLLRNRRSGQGDRLSGVSVALHYGSESEDDPVLSGKIDHSRIIYPTFALGRTRIMLRLQVPCAMTMASRRPRVPIWRRATRSSSCMNLLGVPGTTRASCFLNLSNNFPLAGNILTTISRSNSPSLYSRSGKEWRRI